MFFFFQAEDGIRDYKVTGVQTCALPISTGQGPRHAAGRGSGAGQQRRRSPRRQSRGLRPRAGGRRSEERRVGKECRWRGAADDQKKNTRRRVEEGGEGVVEGHIEVTCST